MAEHNGTLLSGEVKCTCGWTSGHYALASDAEAKFDEHLASEGVPSGS